MIIPDVALVISVITFFTALIAAYTSYINRNKINSIHMELNGRLTELLKTTKELAIADEKIAQSKREKGKKP